MTDITTSERHDLVETLRAHRQLLIGTSAGLTDDQAATRSTVSELTIGGIIKHVTATELQWARFITDGPAAFGAADEAPDQAAWAAGFRMTGEDTLASLVDAYQACAAVTDELASTVDLDSRHPLPVAPWFEPGSTRSARRVLLHLVAETAQHAGHADIIREAIDGATSMG